MTKFYHNVFLRNLLHYCFHTLLAHARASTKVVIYRSDLSDAMSPIILAIVFQTQVYYKSVNNVVHKKINVGTEVNEQVRAK